MRRLKASDPPYGMTAGPNGLAFSLDLRGGQPLGSWGVGDPREIAKIAVGFGVARLIVLDLARIGMGKGVGTLPLISALRADHPTIDIIGGGGVAGSDDLRRLAEAGATAALVGSALHNGRIGRMWWCDKSPGAID